MIHPIRQLGLCLLILTGCNAPLPAQDVQETVADNPPNCFGITIRIPRHENPKIVDYEYLQVWGGFALVRLKLQDIRDDVDTTQDPDFQDEDLLPHATEMELMRNPPSDIWQKARQLLSVPIPKNPDDYGNLWDSNQTWQASYEWWNFKTLFRRNVRSVSDLPIQYAVTEVRMRNEVKGNGVKASVVYPQRDYVIFRWLPVGPGMSTNRFTTVSPAVGAFLKERMDKSPPYFYQLVLRSSLPNPTGGHWNRYGLRLNDTTAIVIELGDIPND